MTKAFRDALWTAGYHTFSPIPEDLAIFKRIGFKRFANLKAHLRDSVLMDALMLCKSCHPTAKLVEMRLRGGAEVMLKEQRAG